MERRHFLSGSMISISFLADRHTGPVRTGREFHLPGETAAEFLRGHGAVADTPQGKAGVYKTEEGKLCQVNIVCPHMGCELNWNPEELTWDCPCHGSRFDREGNLIDGPAREGICHE